MRREDIWEQCWALLKGESLSIYTVTSERTIYSCTEYSLLLIGKKLQAGLIKALKWQLSIVYFTIKALQSSWDTTVLTNISTAIPFLSLKKLMITLGPQTRRKDSHSSTAIFKSPRTLKALHCYHCPHQEGACHFPYLPVLYITHYLKQNIYFYF